MPDGMSAMASSSEATGFRTFSGDSEDAKEYNKRWKTEVSNKILTLAEKMPKEARGAYVYTLSGGKAWNVWNTLIPKPIRRLTVRLCCSSCLIRDSRRRTHPMNLVRF